jgi:hypothetical protein
MAASLGPSLAVQWSFARETVKKNLVSRVRL